MDFRLQQCDKYEVSRNWRKSILDALVAHNVRSIARVASAAPAASFLSATRKFRAVGRLVGAGYVPIRSAHWARNAGATNGSAKYCVSRTTLSPLNSMMLTVDRK